MEKLKYTIKEKELAELILSNLGEDIKDYDYSMLVKSKSIINHIITFKPPYFKFVFKYKRKKTWKQ